MARPQALKFAERRMAIVDSAAALFARDGYASVPITAIATEARISKSLLYHYFTSKEQLLEAVMASHIDALLAAAEAGRDEPLEQLLGRFMTEYIGAADRQKVLLNELDKLPASSRDDIVTKQRRIIAVVEQALTRSREDLRYDASRARAETMMLFGAINWAHTWYRADGPVAPDDFAAIVAARFGAQRS